MSTWRDRDNIAIRVTEERVGHVLEHPEMAGEEERIRRALVDPDRIVQSRSDSRTRLYYRFYTESSVGPKFLCVVVKWAIDDPFLITAYFTDRPRQGEVLWSKQ